METILIATIPFLEAPERRLCRDNCLDVKPQRLSAIHRRIHVLFVRALKAHRRLGDKEDKMQPSVNEERIRLETKKSGNRGRCRKLSL